jgi:hypothetical protein
MRQHGRDIQLSFITKEAHDAARAEMARLRAAHREVRAQLAAARKAVRGRAAAGKAKAAGPEDE